MTLPDFLHFDPAPVRARHDGWTPALQRRFILLLSQGAGPGEAARQVGRGKAGAYALRARPGAEDFAAAWDAAVGLAATVRDAERNRPPILGRSGLEVMLVPRFYRGRLVGFVQREDHAGALRILKQIERLVERSGRDPATEDAALEAFDRMRGTEVD